MNRPTITTATGLIGLSTGALLGMRWAFVSTAALSPNAQQHGATALSLITMLPSLAAVLIVARCRTCRLGPALASLAAGLTGITAYAFAAAVAAALAPGLRGAECVLGDELALDASLYSPPPSAGYYASLTLSLGLLGTLTGAAAAWLFRSSAVRTVCLAALAGAAVAVCVSCTQTFTYFLSMATGHSSIAVVVASSAAWALLSAAVALAACEWRNPTGLTLTRLAPLAVILPMVLYTAITGAGSHEYASISKFYPDITFAYVHFGADGAWRRTLDQSASNTQAWRAEWFVNAYPHSAYRSAAMLQAAECQFELWRFDEASHTLASLQRGYPHLDGYRDILHALTDLAQGNSYTILADRGPDSHFDRWRSTQGAQLAAEAAARAGLPRRARGYQSAYIDYLQSATGTSWTAQAVAFARLKARLIDRSGPPQFGAVTGRVLASGRPVRGARLILVQPHYDAALPSDSRQFTGARTVPAWNGLWALTDKTGRAVIDGVPYGNYEVVLGLDFATSPRGCVVSSAVPAVSVLKPATELKPIDLVPAIELVSPGPGATVPASTELRWNDYPDAASYSVSVIALSNSDPTPAEGYVQPQGTTCWARSGINRTRTALTPDGFVNGHTRLRSDASYMWVVYAYGPTGRLLSSSEHYFELCEPVFTVTRAGGRGHLPAANR